MYIVLSLPNGTTLNTDIVRSSYQYTECLYNDLSPVDNSVKCTIPYSVDLTNALQGYINDYIAATLKDDDGTAIFTGYVRKQASMSKTTKNNDIAIELVPPSVLLNENYGQNTSFINRSMNTVISSLISTKLPNSTVINCPDVTVQICKVGESDNVKTVITDLLFERGYTWTFNAAGVFTCVKLFGMQPSTIGQTFSDGQSGNMYGSYNQDVKERQYDSICAEFKEIAYKENQVIFDDTSTKKLGAGGWLFGNPNGGYLKYDCDGVQSVEYIENASVSVIATRSYSVTFENLYTKGKIILHDTSSNPNTISNIKVTGSGYFVTATSKAKSSNGKKEKTYNVKYLFNRALIEALVKDINDYYRYSATKLTLKSSSDFALGSYCNVVSEGAGQYTARIIRKTHTATSDLITYELESVSSYTPAVVTTDSVLESQTVPVTTAGSFIPALRLSTYGVSSFPAVVTINCVSSDGNTDKPYNAYIRILKDGTTIYRSSNPEQSLRYTIPSGTQTAVVRMETKDGVIYDEEKIVTLSEDGTTVLNNNRYQLFEPAGHSFTATYKGFCSGVEKDTWITKIEGLSGISSSFTGNVATFTPNGEVIDDSEATISIDVQKDEPYVIGINTDNGVIIIGYGSVKLGFSGIVYVTENLKAENYNIAAIQPAIEEVKNDTTEIIKTEIVRNAYLGSISNPLLIPSTPEYGDYWLCSGNMSNYDKGSIYICTGFEDTGLHNPVWELDSNITHQQTAMADTLAILDSIGEENLANLFVRNLVASTAFIRKLFAEKLIMNNTSGDGGFMKSARYSGTIGENGTITAYGNEGWAVDWDGNADFTNMHATNSHFEGEIQATNSTFSGTVTATDGTFNGKINAKSLSLHVNSGDVVLRKISVNQTSSKTYYSQLCASGTYRIKIRNVGPADGYTYISIYSLYNNDTGELIAKGGSSSTPLGTNDFTRDIYIQEGQSLKLVADAGGGGIFPYTIKLDLYICTDSDNGILAYLGDYYSENNSPIGPIPR